MWSASANEQGLGPRDSGRQQQRPCRGPIPNPPISVLRLLGREPHWCMALGDLDLWVTPGAYVGDFRPPR